MFDALRCDDDTRLLSPLDELLVHDLLARRYRVEYEEGEGTRPDFRLYDNSDAYVGAVEVATLFLRKDWASQMRRHAVLLDDLNKRLRLTTHSVELEVRRWDGTPPVRHIAKWIEHALHDLCADPDALPRDWSGTPEKIYSTKRVDISFRFMPLREDYVVKEGDRVVLGGAAISGCIDSAVRLRDRLDAKAGKYDLRGKPYAIVVGIRDDMCDLDDVYHAVNGTSAVLMTTGEAVRKGDGFFGNGRQHADGKRHHVSAVYSIQEWFPGGPYLPRITRFDNPFAVASFPIDALPIHGHWGVDERTHTSVRANWLISPVAPIPREPYWERLIRRLAASSGGT